MAEPVCDVIISPTKATPHANFFVPGLMQRPHSFVDAPTLELKGAPHWRVAEWRDLGYDVKVTSGDDPLDLAIQRGKEAAEQESPAPPSTPTPAADSAPADEPTKPTSGKAAKEKS